MSRQRVDSGRLVTALLSRRISYGYSASAPASSPQPSLLRHHRSDARLCGLRKHRLEAGRRLRSLASLTSPNVLPFPVCIVSAGRHSRESDQRRSRPALGVHPRACREPASPFGGSRRGFPPVNWRDPILGLTELPSPGARSGANGSSLYRANVAPIRSLV
jgi:hypothetical protein